MRGFAGVVLAAFLGLASQLVYVIAYFISVGGRLDVEAEGFPFLFAFGFLVGAIAGLIAAVLPRTSLRGSDNYVVLLVLALIFPTLVMLTGKVNLYGVIIFAFAATACAIICSPRYRDAFWD